MTAVTTTSRDVNTGNGATSAFPTSFAFFDATDLVVTQVDDATSVETILVLNTNYTVTGGDNSTGTVTLTAGALAVGQTLVIERQLPQTQQVDYQTNDPFPAEVQERALDRLTYLVQQVTDVVNRALVLPITATVQNLLIPTPEQDKILVGNAAETGWENKTLAELGSPAETLPLGITKGGTGNITAAAARLGLEVPWSQLKAVTTTAVTLLSSENGALVAASPVTAGGNTTVTLPVIGAADRLWFAVRRQEAGTETLAVAAGSGNTFLAGTPPELNRQGDMLILTATGPNTTWNWVFIPGSVGFKPATASVAGGIGLVPAPSAGEDDEFLRGDGTWAEERNFVDVFDQQDVTDVAQIDINWGSSDYYKVELIVSGLGAETPTNAKVELLTSTDDGSSFDTGASDYDWTANILAVAETFTSSTDAADDSIQLMGSGASSATEIDGNFDSSFRITLIDPKVAHFTAVEWVGSVRNADANRLTTVRGSAFRRSAADVNAVRLLISSGNITGKVTAVGYRKTKA